MKLCPHFYTMGSLNATHILCELIQSFQFGTSDPKNTLYAAYWYLRKERETR